MSKLQVVVGGQYGSEGKGAVAAYLASRHLRGVSVRVAGPNAGHTVIGKCPPDCDPYDSVDNPPGQARDHDPNQHPWRLRQVPVGAVASRDMLLIAAGSEIDLDVLQQEVRDLTNAGYDVAHRLIIDSQATIITDQHRQREQGDLSSILTGGGLVHRIGSTGKGIGAARAARAMREAMTVGDCGMRMPCAVSDDVASIMRYHVRNGIGDVLIEGTQGYLLGTHAGYYPQCTSSDCTAIDFLSMAGISPWEVSREDLEVWVTFRTYPIRVAGNSGPLHRETTWKALGLEPEHTTVTRKVRRVGLWDPAAASQAMAANGHGNGRHSPCRAALTMVDYLIPGLAGMTHLSQLDDDARSALDRLVGRRSSDLGCLISLVGTGPGTMIDLREGE